MLLICIICMLSFVFWVSCLCICLVGLGVVVNVVFKVFSCLVLMVVFGFCCLVLVFELLLILLFIFFLEWFLFGVRVLLVGIEFLFVL